MKTQIVKLSKTTGWITTALGVTHTCYTVIIIKQLSLLNQGLQGTFLFMFVATGIGCLFSGGVMFLSTTKEIRELKTSNQLFLISSFFMMLLGVGAPIAMSDNPFGYISLALGVFAMAVAILRYKN
jgi:hypothetical protein